MDDGVPGIAGHEQNPYSGAKTPGLSGQLATVPARHDDVGEQQIDRGVGSQKLEGSFSVRRSDDAIVQTPQYVRQISTHIDIIFDNQNSFCSLRADDRLIRFADFVDVLSLQAWQVNFDGRTLAHLAVNLYVATRLLDESIHLTQAKPGPLSKLLGGEKWLEGTINHIWSHADPGIRHANNHVLTCGQLRIQLTVVLVYIDVCALKRQLSAIWHSIARIDGEVDQRGLKMICVDLHPPQPGRTNSLNLDFFAQGTLEKFGGAAKKLVDVGGLWIQWLPAGKGKQTACQGRCTLSASHCPMRG
jgi:hypothetical protein